MGAAPPGWLLDLTRLVSRLGRGALTGVDRVELAWLEHLATRPVPLWGLVRTALGFVLLDGRGAQMVRDCATGIAPLGAADLLGRISRWDQPLRARAESDLRRVALARCMRPLLGRMLSRHLPTGTVYLNVGHADLAQGVMRAVRGIPAAKVLVLVHDTIPLDHPEFSRPGIPAVFARKLAVVAAAADLVIHTTEATRERTERHLAALGRVPPGVVAALGVPVPRPEPELLPPGLDLTRPYYVTIGTIEPRKNHALLLEVWDKLPDRLPGLVVPRLFVVGGRGWADASVLARLDAAAQPGQAVIELPGLPDGAVAALLAGAEALLFPSLAEGYGLPPLEAMALNVPVICAALAVFRETLGDYPVYLDATNSYSWLETIAKNMTAGEGRGENRQARKVPGWADHFNVVLNCV